MHTYQIENINISKMFASHGVDFPCKNDARNQVNKHLQSIDKRCWGLNCFNERAIVPFYNVVQLNKGKICFKEAIFNVFKVQNKI